MDIEEEGVVITPKGLEIAEKAIELFGQGMSLEDIATEVGLDELDDGEPGYDPVFALRLIVAVASVSGALD